MKRSALVAAAASWLFLAGSADAQTMEFGMKVGPGGLSEIGFVYSEYYRVQPAVVVDLERRRLPEDDVSVLLFLSQQSGMAPAMILKWRAAGDSWWVITQRLRLDPVAVYYVPVPDHVRPGPPYGRAYGHYRKHPQGKQKKSSLREAAEQRQAFVFDDDDIRNLVQLRLVSGHYGYRAEEVMQRRERGELFNRMIRTEYERKHRKSSLREAVQEPQRDDRRGRRSQEDDRYERDRKKEKKEKKDKKHGRYDDDDHPGKGKKNKYD